MVKGEGWTIYSKIVSITIYSKIVSESLGRFNNAINATNDREVMNRVWVGLCFNKLIVFLSEDTLIGCF